MRDLRRDDGWASLELVLMTPVLLLALMFVVLAGRVGSVQADVTGASRDAARAASMQANHGAAQTAAYDTAAATLADRQVTCRTLTVEVSGATEFVAGGRVGVQVRCAVQLADLALPGIPGSRVVTASSSEPIDTYRWVG